MKLIKEIKIMNHTDYFYENNIIQRIWYDREIYWFKDDVLHKEDGAAIQNCIYCVNKLCDLFNANKYKRHFYLNKKLNSTTQFAVKTNHKVCLICNDFCNQECFMEEI